MIIDVVMPKMGESLQEGTILRWLKKTGDKIERDEMILEISTDKVDTEIPSPTSGYLSEILAQENETIEVGKVIARISTEETEAVSLKPEMAEKDVPVNVQPPKSEMIQEEPAKVEYSEETKEIPRADGKSFYSPLVRSIAEAEGVTLEQLRTITGTGVNGRITKQDLLDYIENAKKAPKPAEKPLAPKPSEEMQPKPTTARTPVFANIDDVEIIPMDRMRQLIAEHMVYSKQTSPHVTSVGEADVTGIVKFRNKNKDTFEAKEGYKLTYTPFFAKAAIDGIILFPRVNVSVDGKNIIQHKRINLGFATALEDGNLIVPVIKNADSLSLQGLARSVFDLSTRARTKKLNPDDIQGGTFAITNVGTFGTLFGTPIINQPQCAIMGIGAVKKRAVVKEIEGEYFVVARDMAYVSITYDHRVIDGMLAGKYLAAVIKSLESMNETNIVL